MASKETINLEIKLNTAIERKLGKLARLTGKLDFDVKSINLGIQKLNFALQTTSTLLGELSMALGQVAARSQMTFNTRGLSSYNNLLRQATMNARNLSLRPGSIPLSLTSGSRYIQNSRYLPAVRSRGGGSLIDASDLLLANQMRRIGTGGRISRRGARNVPLLNQPARPLSIASSAARNVPLLSQKAVRPLSIPRRENPEFEVWVNRQMKKYTDRGIDPELARSMAIGSTGISWEQGLHNKEPKAFRKKQFYNGYINRVSQLPTGGKRSRAWRVGNVKGPGVFGHIAGATIGSGVYSRLMGLASNPYALAVAGVGAVAGKAIHEAGRKEFRTQQLRTIFGKNQGSLVMEGITQFANVTPFTNAFLADQVQQLGAVGFGRQSALKKMRTLGEFSYGDTNRFKSIMSAYTKMVSKGRLDAEVRNQFLETGKIDPLQIIARSEQTITDPKTKRELTDYAERLAEVTRMFHAGEIGASLLINAMDGVAGTMTGLKDASQTLEGQLSTAQGQFNEAMAQLGTNLLPVATKALKRLNDSLGFFLGEENAFDFFNKFGYGSYADLRRMPEDLRKKVIRSKLTGMSDRELDYAQDKAAALGMKKQRLTKPSFFALVSGRIGYTKDQLTEAINQDIMKDPDTISGDSTSKDSDLGKGITSGGGRQKYITIDIGTVQAANTINIENSDDTVDMVQNNLITALFKAIAYSGEIAQA